MSVLGIDIETFSSIDITRSGVYKYTESPDFEVLLFAYSLNNAPVQIIDLTIDELPEDIENALTDSTVIKTSWNSNFERVCLAKHLNKPMPPEQWRCTMVHAAMVGLPLSLDAAAKVLKLDVQKDSIGKSLIRFFSIPCKPTKKNGERLRNLPEHAPEKWEQYKAYCVKDVEVEQAIAAKIAFYQIPPMEQKVWELDQKINDNGIELDPVLVENAIQISQVNTERLMAEAIETTGLDNPNSIAQLKEWLETETGETVEGLTKKDIPQLLKVVTSDKATRVLQIRQEMAKTSVKKFTSMRKCMCADNRARGLFQYYGANRTGRHSGRLIQPQNFAQNKLRDLDLARELTKAGDIESLDMLFGNVPDTLSQLIRTALVAKEGHRFIIVDFAAIELIVAAWLSGEKWIIDEYAGERKMYEHAASRMFNVPVEKVTKSSAERQKGKIASLACQFGGGKGAILMMDTKKEIPEDQIDGIIKSWRKANPNIVKCWYQLEESAIKAVKTGEIVRLQHGMAFIKNKGVLFFKLPSGRMLSYVRPHVKPGKFGNDALYFEGMDQTTKQWKTIDTYGGKLFENLCQSVARDLLMESMVRLDAKGYNVCLHVHDETACEMPYGAGSLSEMISIMTEPVKWAPGLYLHAEGFETTYYKKD